MTKRTYFRYVSQNIIGMISLSCYILVDTLFVSRALGTNGLASLNLAITVFSIISGIGQLLGVGFSTNFALRQSEGKPADACFGTALRIGSVISLCCLFTGLFLAQPLSILLGANEETLSMTTTYVRVTLLFSPAFMLNAVLQGFVRNDGSPRLAMFSLLTSSFLNILLDYLFMFPLQMGMFGAVFATGLSACLSTPVLLSHFKAAHCRLRLSPHALSPREALQALSCGLSALIGELASAVSLLTFNLLLMHLVGSIGVAAYGVIANTALIATAIFTGLGQGIQPLASHAYGTCDRVGMRLLLRYIYFTVAALSLLIFSFIFLFAQPITNAFNHEGSTLLTQLASNGLRIYFAGYLFAGLSIAASAFLSAISRPAHALLISLLRSCLLLIPCALILSRLFGVTGVWLSFTFTECLCCMLSLFLLTRQGDCR